MDFDFVLNKQSFFTLFFSCTGKEESLSIKEEIVSDTDSCVISFSYLITSITSSLNQWILFHF